MPLTKAHINWEMLKTASFSKVLGCAIGLTCRDIGGGIDKTSTRPHGGFLLRVGGRLGRGGGRNGGTTPCTLAVQQ